MKIGVVYTGICNAYYRAVWPIGGLGARGHEVVQVIADPDSGKPDDISAVEGCDVVFFYRARGVQPKAVARLRQQGAAIVYDNDDDHQLLPQGSPGLERYNGLAGHRGHRHQTQVLRHADVLTTTSELLAQRFSEGFDGHVKVLENYVGPFQFAKEKPPSHDGILIGWVAGHEHRADAQMLRMTDVLRRVMERDPRVRVETCGVRLDLDPARYTFSGVVQFEELAPHISRWDLGIAPIVDIPMSHARSNVKVKEYAAAGVPWVASDRGPYKPLGRSCGGLLVDDDGWEDALVDLAGSRFRRRLMRRQAQAWAKTQRIENHVVQWEDVAQLAVESAARQVA